MLRGPDGTHRVEQATADYLHTTAEALGLANANQLPDAGTTELNIGRLAAQAAQAAVETRQLLEVNEKALDILFNTFVPAVVEAHAAAHDIALTQGQFTPTDETSLAHAGSGLEQLREYLAPFRLQEDASLPEDVPPLNIGTLLRLKGLGANGGDGYLSNLSSMHSVVDYGTSMPKFAKEFNAPLLVDPMTYTVEEFANLSSESADGYAQQVVDTWRSIQESERDNPSFTGQPLIVRAVAVLPVLSAEGTDTDTCAVDFLPQLGKTQADKTARIQRAYDVRLLVRGSENIGSDYLSLDYSNQQPVYANIAGKRAPFTVQRGAVIDEAFPASVDDLGLTPRSQGAMALYIAPHVIKQKPSAPITLPANYGNNLMYGDGAKTGRGSGLGAASIGVGPASFVSSDKRAERFVDRIAPELEGRPIIVSLQLLTFER